MSLPLWRSLYAKIAAVFLVLLLILGAALSFMSVKSAMEFISVSDQKLNLRLAGDLTKEFHPFLQDSIDMAGIEHTIHYMMVMNPRVEIYLLDAEGKILAFFAEPGKTVKKEFVDLTPIHRFLENHGDMPIMGDDPRHLDRRKTFSAAPLAIGKNINGYLYVILGGEEYDSASAMMRESYILRTSMMSLAIILSVTAVVGLVLFALLTKRLRAMTAAVKEFERGNYGRRLTLRSHDEIGQLAKSFNQMADTITANMEELKRTDNLRRELIANVSHDLRSPLASIQGYLETVLIKDETYSPEERRRYLQIIFDNTKMLGKLVSELFELSKLDARQTQPQFEAFSLAELAQDVVMKFKPQAEKLNVQLHAALAQNLPRVYADLGMIERVLSNFIENALRFTPEAGSVRVDLHNGRGKVRVVITDTGCGIPPEDVPRVFDRFYRAEKSRGRASGGSGLGMAIAKRILDLHDSTVSLHSTLNIGTTITFDLNIAPAN